MASLEVVSVALQKQPRATDKEQELLRQLNKHGVTVDVVVPDDIDADGFRTAVSAVCKTLVNSATKLETIIPVLGRLLLVARDHEELWKSKFEDYESFIGGLEEEYGLKRASLYEFRKLVERWGAVIDVERFGRIGRVKLGRVGGVIDIGKEGNAEARSLLTFAEEHTLEELDKKLHEKYHTDKDPSGASLRITGSKSAIKRAEKFFGDPRIQAVCESDKPIEILGRMMEECSGEWLANGEELIKQQQAEKRKQAQAEAAGAEG